MKVLVVFLAVLAVTLAYKRYDNYKILNVPAHSLLHAHALKFLEDNADLKTNFLVRPRRLGQSAKILVPSETCDSVQKYLRMRNIQYIVINEDVQKTIDEERGDLPLIQYNSQRDSTNLTLNKYHQYQQISDWLDALAAANPSFVNVSSLGKSTEGRDLKLIKIGKPGPNKNGFWIDSGIHAREWASVSTNVYVINELVTKYTTNATYAKLIDTIDFYIMPIMNPDGYEFTFTGDRMWRKTRSGPYSNGCYGVDPNRNWDFQWGGQGTSTDPCSDIYDGPKAFSEPECLAESQFLTANKDVLKAMLTLHTFSEDMLYPYGYAINVFPPDVKDLIALGNEAAVAVKSVFGTVYSVVNSAGGLYPAAGASDDWSKHLGIKWVYTWELRPGPGDTDHDENYGFQLPAKYIMKTAEETWAGLLVVANRVMTGPN